MRGLRCLWAAALLGTVSATTATRAADLGIASPVLADGAPCQAPIVQTFGSVWQGHVSGGYSHYLGPGETIVLDWRDEKLCFPSRSACSLYVNAMRRDFHRPEGYFTCLPIR